MAVTRQIFGKVKRVSFIAKFAIGYEPSFKVFTEALKSIYTIALPSLYSSKMILCKTMELVQSIKYTHAI